METRSEGGAPAALSRAEALARRLEDTKRRLEATEKKQATVEAQRRKQAEAVRRLQRPLTALVPSAKPKRRTAWGDVEGAILAFFCEHPEGARSKQIADALEDRIPRSTVRDRLARMKAKGGPLRVKAHHGGSLYIPRKPQEDAPAPAA